MTFPAIILAGGKSQRMGEDKSLIEIEGKQMILHIIENLKIAGCNDILIQTKQNRGELKSILSNLLIPILPLVSESFNWVPSGS